MYSVHWFFSDIPETKPQGPYVGDGAGPFCVSRGVVRFRRPPEIPADSDTSDAPCLRKTVMLSMAKRSSDDRRADGSARHPKENRYANGAARRKLRAWLKAQGLPCHICGLPIDYTLDWYVDPRDGRRKRHPMSFEVDELVPVSLGGSPTDRSNVAPAHRICNERRGNKVTMYVTRAPGKNSLPTKRNW